MSGMNRLGEPAPRFEPVKKMGNTMMVEDVSYKKNANIDNIRGKMQKEAQDKIELVSDKMELEYMIQDQKDAQENLKTEFDRMTREKKNQIDRLENMNNDIDKQIDELAEKKENLHQEVNKHIESKS